MLVTIIFFPFLQSFLPINRQNQAQIILSPVEAFDLDVREILLSGKELNLKTRPK